MRAHQATQAAACTLRAGERRGPRQSLQNKKHGDQDYDREGHYDELSHLTLFVIYRCFGKCCWCWFLIPLAGMAERQKEWQNGRMAEMDTYDYLWYTPTPTPTTTLKSFIV